MSTTTNSELTKAAADEAIDRIAALSDDDVADLNNYNGRDVGFPIGLEVEIEDGEVEAIQVYPGHGAAGDDEWHNIRGLLEMVRSGDVDQARELIVNSIEIAVENALEAA